MEKRMNRQELIELIGTLEIDKEEFWVLSSGALVLRGIFPDAGDLDIAVTSKGLEQLKNQFDLKQKDNGFYTVCDKIECVEDTKESWKYERVGDYNVQDINVYLDFLKHSNREKDKARIGLVEDYIKNRKNNT